MRKKTSLFSIPGKPRTLSQVLPTLSFFSRSERRPCQSHQEFVKAHLILLSPMVTRPLGYEYNQSHKKICDSHLKALSVCYANPRPLPNMTPKRRAQPHNAYNIFFILERKRLIYELEGSVVDNHQQMSYDLDGYENLCLPNLPPKYQHLHLPPGWFVPGKNSKRKHAKTHGSKLIVDILC